MKINKSIPVLIAAVSSLLIVSGCTPGDEEYCNGYGVQGTPEYGKCLDYYHQQDGAFSTDESACDLTADASYPATLYDYGHDVQVPRFATGPHGEVYSVMGYERIPPDYAHNAQIDALRMRIIAPCMDQRGWNSPTDWRAGRHGPSRPINTQQKMPWQ